jgi:hypothetical protein
VIVNFSVTKTEIVSLYGDLFSLGKFLTYVTGFHRPSKLYDVVEKTDEILIYHESTFKYALPISVATRIKVNGN